MGEEEERREANGLVYRRKSDIPLATPNPEVTPLV
jgi:hypothetical protein